MTVKCLLYVFGYDAGAHIVFKYTIDDRTMGRNDQKVALARDVAYAAGFRGQILLLFIRSYLKNASKGPWRCCPARISGISHLF